jgi:tetratricopeptide (TPR) repeat protein
MNGRIKYIIIAILVIACLAAFSPIAGNRFISYDDPGYIFQNYQIQQGINLQTIKWAFTTTYLTYWHPLTWLSHALDWKIFGPVAGAHHLVSLFLHIGAVIFLFLFLFKTTDNLWPSAFAAAFFALHPLRVESVAWAAERKDVLSMFFGMAALYAYAFYAERSRISLYFCCLLLFAMALMSKPIMVTLPFALLLVDYWPLNRWQKLASQHENGWKVTGRLVGEKAPFFILTAASSIVTIAAQSKGGAVVPSELLPFYIRLNNAIIAYLHYLLKSFWPVDLAIFYPYNLSFSIGETLLSVLVLLFITTLVVYYFRKLPFLFTGWFWYLGTMIPMIGLIQSGAQGMADRHSYLPSIGMAVMLAWGIPFLLSRENIRKKILFPAAVIILFVLSSLTYKQCGSWKNSIVLFSYTLEVTKNNHLAHSSLATALMEEGSFAEAIYHYDQALRINPRNVDDYNNRGTSYFELGRYDLAIDDFNKAIRIDPQSVDAYYNKGTAYTNIGNYKLAIENYTEAIRLDPDYVGAYYTRGIIYMKTGLYQSAVSDFTELLRRRPDNEGVLDLLNQAREKAKD